MLRGSGNRDSSPGRSSRSLFPVLLLCALASQLPGQAAAACDPGSTGVDTKPCVGSYYLSTGQVGGGASVSMNSSAAHSSKLNSLSNAYQFVLQTDGNMVVYQNSTVIWPGSGLNAGTGPWDLTLQTDGNLVRCVWDDCDSA